MLKRRIFAVIVSLSLLVAVASSHAMPELLDGLSASPALAAPCGGGAGGEC